MGKTKTAFVSEDAKPEKSSAEAYHEKKERRKKEAEKIHIAGLKGGQRVKVVEAAPTEESPIPEAEEKTGGGKRAKQTERIRSQKYKESKAKFDNSRKYKVSEAVKLIKDISYSKFDGTVELHLVVKKTGISAQVALPHTAGREKKIEVATEKTIEALKAGKIDFDVLVATPDMMPKLVPFARLLGPKGLMPNPKNGTLVPDVKKAKSFSAGTVTLKTEKEAPLIHTVVGKVSQKDSELAENTEAVFRALKGTDQIVKAYMKSTMSPSVKLAI